MKYVTYIVIALGIMTDINASEQEKKTNIAASTAEKTSTQAPASTYLFEVHSKLKIDTRERVLITCVDNEKETRYSQTTQGINFYVFYDKERRQYHGHTSYQIPDSDLQAGYCLGDAENFFKKLKALYEKQQREGKPVTGMTMYFF